MEKQRGVEESTQEKTSRRGKFRARLEEEVHEALPPGERWGDVQIYFLDEIWAGSIEMVCLMDRTWLRGSHSTTMAGRIS